MQESSPTTTDTPLPGGRLLLAAAGLAALLAIALALAPMLSTALRLGLAAIFGGSAAALAWYGYRRQREALAALATALRALGQQRNEVRAPSDLPGAFASMADDLNRIAAKLAEQHGEVDTRIATQVRWLKRERDDLAAQNQQLRSGAAREQDEARAQSERLSSMSHELRTPLTGILGYADLMRRTRLDTEQLHQLNTIDQSARALLTMINDLLDWSRIEAGRLKLDEARFDLLDTIESTITLLAPLAYNKHLELVRIIYHDVPRELQGDAQRLRQILTNLLSNAIKFTERGEVVLRVMGEREEPGRTWLRFAVTDSGVGMNAEQQERLFRPFSQVGQTQGAGGSGLGLSITRKLVELIGGEIGVESTPGQGSTFSTLLPYKLISADASTPHDQQPLGAHRVWLFEPHAAAKLALMHGLEFWGLTVESFTGIDALANAFAASSAAGRPELICLGLDAQTLDHPDTTRLLGLSRDSGVPTLALVNSVNPSVHEQLRNAGARISHPKSVARQQLYRDLDLLLHPERDAPQALRGRRALVADNNVINRHYLALMCKQLGLDTSEAADGRDGYEQWRAQRPDVVLLDARMPRLDGPGCARAIREVEGTGPRCRIVAVSAHLEPDERRNFLAAGADAVLIKPFDEAQLLAALEPSAITQHHPATKLAKDPELASLLREELPLQFAALESAIHSETLEVARDAAHTLRGTAAFYHLAQLRQTTAAVEEWLRSADSLNNGPETRRKLDRVRSAVSETLAAMRSER